MIFMIGALIMIMSAVGMPLSVIVGASKLPSWAKPNPLNSWGRPWIDSRPWLKKLIIKVGQVIIVGILFFFNFTWHLIKALGKIFVKTLEGSAKKMVKK